ncbi:MAG TPA: hypothetical protein PLH90_01915, partial [Candidatus Paceibacterota bacterium]|nr:hypothetical protein [Candidatus Paceibacterota bacterium]
LRGLRYATVGIGRDVSASFGMAIMRIPLFRGLVNTFQLMKSALNVTKFWFGRQRNKYYTFLSKNSNPQARAADNIGVFYIGAMLKYDIMISHLRSIEQHLTGKKSRAPKVETWSNDSKENNQRSSGSGFFSNIKEKFIGRKRKKTAPSWEAYERYDEFGNIIPGNYAEGATKVAGDKIPEYVKKSSVYKYFDKKYSKLEKTIKGTDTFKYIKKKYKKVRKSKSVIGIEDFIGDLQSGDFDTEERLEDLKKGTKKTYKKGKKWTKQHVTGVSGKGLAEAALWVTVIAPVKTLIGAVKIVNKSVIGIAKATMWMAKLPFRVLFKTVSIAIRSLLMIGRGISKLTHALVSLPFKLANTVVNMGTKIITGALSGISSVFRYIGKAGGVGAAIKKVASKAWYGSGKRTAGKKGASKVAAANAREKQKTGVEGELQKIRHSITEFHGSVSEDWADMKFDKKKDNKWVELVKNWRKKAKSVASAWAKTKKSYQYYRDKKAGKERKIERGLMERIADATEGTRKDLKKRGSKLWDWIKTAATFVWGIGSKIVGLIRFLTGGLLTWLGVWFGKFLIALGAGELVDRLGLPGGDGPGGKGKGRGKPGKGKIPKSKIPKRAPKGLGKLGKYAPKIARMGKVGGALTIAAAAYEGYQFKKEKEKDYGKAGSTTAGVAHGTVVGASAVAGALGGAKAGALLGATIGSVVPGLGTAAGAAAGTFVGGLVGGIGGAWAGSKAAKLADQAGQKMAKSTTSAADKAMDKTVQQTSRGKLLTEALKSGNKKQADELLFQITGRKIKEAPKEKWSFTQPY